MLGVMQITAAWIQCKYLNIQLFTHNPTLLVIKDLRQLLETYTINNGENKLE